MLAIELDVRMYYLTRVVDTLLLVVYRFFYVSFSTLFLESHSTVNKPTIKVQNKSA